MDYVAKLDELIAAAEAEGDDAHVMRCALRDARGCAVDFAARDQESHDS